MALIQTKTDTINAEAVSDLIAPSSTNKIVKTVATIANLNFQPTFAQTVNVLGYATQGDGGEGTYVYDSTYAQANANGSSVIDPTGTGTGTGCWVKQSPVQKGSVNVLDFIPLSLHASIKDGTNTADLSGYIQSAIDSGISTNIYFPDGEYLISDTLHFGRFNVNGGDDVLGYIGSEDGWRITGANGGFTTATIKWVGANQAGTTKTTKTDSLGTYPLVTDAKPMLSIIAGRNHYIENISLDGDNKAYTGIHYQGNQAHCTHINVRTSNVKIGIRNGQRWDYETSTQYYGYADSPYCKANFYDAPTVGGWQGDTHSYTGCSIGGTLACYSSESLQNLALTFSSVIFRGTLATYGIALSGGRINLNGVGFVGTISDDDIRCITGGGVVVGNEVHSESGATNFFDTGTVTSSQLSLTSCDNCNTAITSGGGKFSYNNCTNVSIIRTDGNYRTDIDIKNSEIDLLQFATTSYPEQVFLTVDNCVYGGSGEFLQGGGASGMQLSITNTTPHNVLPLDGQSAKYLVASTTGSESKLGRRIEKINSTYGQKWTGNALEFYGFHNSLASGVATVIAQITPYIGYGGSAFIDIMYSNSSSTSKFSHADKIVVTWTADSAGNVVASVTKGTTSQSLDGFSSVTTAYTSVLSGTVGSGGTIDIGVTETNNLGVNAIVMINGKVMQALNPSAYKETLDVVIP